MISDDLVQKITDLWKNATGKIRYDKPVLSVFFDGNGDPQFVSSANPLPTSGGAGGVASLALGTTADSAATSGTGNWSMIALLKGIITSLQSSLLFKNTPLTSETASNIASSATNVTLLSANANRRSLSIFNDSTAVLYIKFGATASTSSYKLQIAAGGYYEMPQPAYPGQIDGIWASANGNARISEGV